MEEIWRDRKGEEGKREEEIKENGRKEGVGGREEEKEKKE